MEPFDQLPGQEPLTVTGRVTTSKSKRYLVAAGVLAGGVALGALLSPIGLAGAQDGGGSGTSAADGGGTTPSTAAGPADTRPGTDTDKNADDKNADDTSGDGDHHGKGHHGPWHHDDELATVLGLTNEELWSQLADGKSLGEIADAQGVSRDTVVDTLAHDVADHLADAVADGRMTQSEADTKLADTKDALREMIDKGWDDWADGWGWGHDDDDDDGAAPGHHHGGGWSFGHSDELQATADSLGLNLDQLRTDVDAGKSIAEAAEAQGVAADKVAAALKAKAVEHIDQALADGRITQARADELKANLDTTINDFITAKASADHHGWGDWDWGDWGKGGWDEGWGDSWDDGGWGDSWDDHGHDHGSSGGSSGGQSGSGDTQQSSFRA